MREDGRRFCFKITRDETYRPGHCERSLCRTDRSSNPVDVRTDHFERIWPRRGESSWTSPDDFRNPADISMQFIGSAYATTAQLINSLFPIRRPNTASTKRKDEVRGCQLFQKHGADTITASGGNTSAAVDSCNHDTSWGNRRVSSCQRSCAGKYGVVGEEDVGTCRSRS